MVSETWSLAGDSVRNMRVLVNRWSAQLDLSGKRMGRGGS